MNPNEGAEADREAAAEKLMAEARARLAEAGEPAPFRVVVESADGKGVDVYEIGRPFPDVLRRPEPPKLNAFGNLPIDQRRSFLDAVVYRIFLWDAQDGKEAYVEVLGQPWGLPSDERKPQEHWTLSQASSGLRMEIPRSKVRDIVRLEHHLVTLAYVDSVDNGEGSDEAPPEVPGDAAPPEAPAAS